MQLIIQVVVYKKTKKNPKQTQPNFETFSLSFFETDMYFMVCFLSTSLYIQPFDTCYLLLSTVEITFSFRII